MRSLCSGTHCATWGLICPAGLPSYDIKESSTGQKRMRTDDSRLEEARKQLLERIKKYDEMMLTVFKNHLGCEQFLNELLSASSRRWKGRMCGGKIEIAKTLDLPEIEPSIWKALEAGNKLRSQVAHSPDESKIAAKMAAFRKAYSRQGAHRLLRRTCASSFALGGCIQT
jgi:hypothetical protein